MFNNSNGIEIFMLENNSDRKSYRFNSSWIHLNWKLIDIESVEIASQIRHIGYEYCIIPTWTLISLWGKMIIDGWI